MIIVTGADNTGKTTLVQHIKDKYKIPEMPRYHTLPPVDPIDWYDWVKGCLKTEAEMVIDRFYIDEFVYGPIKRGKVMIPANRVSYLNHLVTERRPLIILTDTNIDNIKATFGQREQYPELDEIPQIQDRFKEVLSSSTFKRCPQFTYDFTWDSDYIGIDWHLEFYLKTKGVI